MIHYQIRNKTVSHSANLLQVAWSVSILSVVLIQSLKKGPKYVNGFSCPHQTNEILYVESSEQGYSKVSY